MRPPAAEPAFSLQQNFPNPVTEGTSIPLELGDPPECPEGPRACRVRLRIYDVMAQPVATPLLQRGGQGLGGTPVGALRLGCGRCLAYWDGTSGRAAREVASGVYLYRLDVDGRAKVRKMLVVR